MIAHRPQMAAVYSCRKRERNSGTSILIGHWVEQALQARQPDIASLTSCEKSYSPLRACQLLRVRATSERRLTPCSGSAFSSWLGSTPRSARAQPFHTSVAPARRVDALVADFHRRTHRALDVKVEAQPVAITLHRPASCCARDGDLPIPVPRFAASTFIIGASIPSGGQIFPGFRRLSGSKTALILRSSAYSVSPKKAGLYSRGTLCHVRPPAGRHTSPSALPRRRSASSAPPAADRTCPAPGARAAPASTWPNMP